MVLCSSARRARETLDALRPALGDTADVRIESELYGAEALEIIERLRSVDAKAPSVIVIAHNPGLADLAILLAADDGDATALEQLHTKFPTGALATLDVRSTWAGLGPGQAQLRSLVTPKQLL